MLIILYLTVFALLCYGAGWGLVSLYYANLRVPVPLTIAIGYALLVVVSYSGYLIFRQMLLATVAAVVPILLIDLWALCSTLLYRRTLTVEPEVASAGRSGLQQLWLAAFVLILSASTYLVAGFGNYWHTANEDVFDGLRGRDAYLAGDFLATTDASGLMSTLRSELDQTLKTDAGIDPELSPEVLQNRFAYATGMLQYSSIAVFSVLLGLPTGMDVFLFQAILNLLLFALGLDTFLRTCLGLTGRLSVSIALASTLGNFYFATFLNGHIGSLMYNAVIPYVLILLHGLVTRPANRFLAAGMIGLLTIFVGGAYPYPLVYLLAPLSVYGLLLADGRMLDGRIQRMILARPVPTAAILLLLGALAAVIAFWIGEPIRAKALLQYRSWGTMFNHVGFLQFWGIWPSTLAYTVTPLGWLNEQFSIKLLSIIVCLALSLVTVFGILRTCRRWPYLVIICTPMAVYFYLLMWFAFHDSYYMYKYLYIYAWFVYLFAATGIAGLLAAESKIFKFGAALLALVWLAANAVNNTAALVEIAAKRFNVNAEAYAELTDAPAELLSDSFIDIPQYDHGDLVRQLLSEHGIQTARNKERAEYLLLEKGLNDVLDERLGETLWESELFLITRAASEDLPEIASYWSPEGSEYPFRWVSDLRNGPVYLALHRASGRMPYLYVCGETGPSIDYRDLELKVLDADGREAGRMFVGPYDCHTLNIAGYREPFQLVHDQIGESASLIDQRKLIYRIMHLGFSGSPLLNSSLYHLPGTPEIPVVVGAGVPALNVALGAGWYPFETYEGEQFRWARSGAQLTLGNGGAGHTLRLDVAAGPSAASGTLNLIASDALGRKLAECEIIGRGTCRIPLPEIGGQTLDILFASDAEPIPVAGDPRVLNFRVFGIRIE